MWFWGNSRNRLWNTVWIVPRTAGAWLHAIWDATKTALYWALDIVEWIGKTATDIKTAVSNACKNWPRYHKLWKAPASLIASPFMAIEWVAETLRHSWCNIFRNARNTVAHPFINFGHWVKRLWSKEDIRNFKFEKTDEKWVSPKNRLASLFK